MPSLTEMYPLIPSFPYYGPHYILIWWNPDDHHHGIVVQDENSIFRTYEALFNANKRYIPKPIEYWKVNIVRPPPEACQEHAEHELANELNSFSWWLEQMEKTGVLTPGEGFARCPSYEPPSDSEEVLDEYCVTEHIECQSCRGRKFLWRGQHFTEAFLAVRDLWRDYQVGCGQYLLPSAFVTLPSDLPTARAEDGVVYCAALYSSNGFSIAPMGDYWPPLFFFQGEKIPLPENVLKVYTAANEEEQKKAELEKAVHALRYEKRAAEQLQREKEACARILARLKEVDLPTIEG